MQTKNAVGLADWVDPDDAPVLTEAEVGDVEVFEGDRFVRRGRGRPKTGNAKELISVRLDPEVLALLRQAGPGWQSQINGLLRAGLGLKTNDA
jgi:uncharacterized protein (DUF4415 family)